MGSGHSKTPKSKPHSDEDKPKATKKGKLVRACVAWNLNGAFQLPLPLSSAEAVAESSVLLGPFDVVISATVEDKALAEFVKGQRRSAPPDRAAPGMSQPIS